MYSHTCEICGERFLSKRKDSRVCQVCKSFKRVTNEKFKPDPKMPIGKVLILMKIHERKTGEHLSYGKFVDRYLK